MPKKKTRHDLERDRLYDWLESQDPTDDKYRAVVQNLKTFEEAKPASNLPNANAILTAATYGAVTVAVLVFEAYGHTLTSRVLTLSLPKPKL